MRPHERLHLSMWQKWRRFGRPPWKFFIHILLLAFTTAQLVVWNEQDGGYYRAATRNWQYWFLPDTHDFSLDVPTESLFTYDQVTDSFKEAVHHYYRIDELSVDSYTYVYVPNPRHGSSQKTIITPPRLEYTYYKHPAQIFSISVANPDMSTATETLDLNSTFLGPFDVTSLGRPAVVANINRMQKATIHIPLQSFIFGNVYRSCLVWDIRITWDFVDRGQVEQSVSSFVSGSCDETTLAQALRYKHLWLNFPIGALAVIYLVLSIKAIFKSIAVFLEVRRRTRFTTDDDSAAGQYRSARWTGAPVTWSDLSLRDKLRFFNIWFAFTAVSCACLVTMAVGNIASLRARGPTLVGNKLLAGAGCALIWMTLLSYLEHYPGYYILIATLRSGVPRVARFMVGVMPVMLGYAFFGMVCFGGYTDRFESFSASMITLFAVLNGDVIRETYLQLLAGDGNMPVVAQIYMYTFICLFIYVVLNVFIAIIEAAFFLVLKRLATSKKRRRQGRSVAATSNASQPNRQAPRYSVAQAFVMDDDLTEGEQAELWSSTGLPPEQQQQQQQQQQEQQEEHEHGPASPPRPVNGTSHRPSLSCASAPARVGRAPIGEGKDGGAQADPNAVDDGMEVGSGEDIASSWNRFQEILHVADVNQIARNDWLAGATSSEIKDEDA